MPGTFLLWKTERKFVVFNYLYLENPHISIPKIVEVAQWTSDNFGRILMNFQ